MTGLVTGHCHIKAHLFKLGPVNIPSVTDVNSHPEQPHTFLVTVKLLTFSGASVDISCNEVIENICISRILHSV